jgi:hypothetical protein
MTHQTAENESLMLVYCFVVYAGSGSITNAGNDA